MARQLTYHLTRWFFYVPKNPPRRPPLTPTSILFLLILFYIPVLSPIHSLSLIL